MAELNPGPMQVPTPPATPTEKLEYRPLSMFAVAGLAFGVFFALLALGATFWGMSQQGAVFLSGWTIIFPIVGAVFSFVALRQIQASEGVVAGQGIAQWGLMVSVFGGLGYAAFTFVTGLALSSQADQFLQTDSSPEKLIPTSGFFPHLVAGAKDRVELNKAFLLTLPASKRAGDPADPKSMARLHDNEVGGKGNLTIFRDNWLVESITTSHGDDVKIEALGMQTWEATQGSYRVVRNYRVTTTEAVYEVGIPVISTEAMDEGERRNWFVGFRDIEKRSRHTTERGYALLSARKYVAENLNNWMGELVAGKTPPFHELDRTDWSKVALQTIPEGYLKKELAGLFDKGQRLERLTINKKADITPWKMTDGKLSIYVPLSINFPAQSNQPDFVAQGYIIVETTREVDLDRPFTEQVVGWNVIGVELTSIARYNPTPIKG